MKTTLATTTTIGATAITYNQVTTDGKYDSKKAKDYAKKSAISSLVSTATSESSFAYQTKRNEEVHRRWRESHSSEYVDSLSDEELACMLEDLNLLESSMNEENDIKSL